MADVLIRNKRPQAVNIVILDESGALKRETVEPYGVYGPVAENRIGILTKGLAENGHVRIVPAA